MKKHQATWLLAVLVALGTGQAVAVSNFEGRRATSAIAQVVKLRREKRCHRPQTTRHYGQRAFRLIAANHSTRVIQPFWNARLLRAPPASSIV
jgi:hypothetical protein